MLVKWCAHRNSLLPHRYFAILNFIKDLLKAVICFFAVKQNMKQQNTMSFARQEKNPCILKYVKRKTKANLWNFCFYDLVNKP